jgi:hypothetical protein
MYSKPKILYKKLYVEHGYKNKYKEAVYCILYLNLSHYYNRCKSNKQYCNCRFGLIWCK